MSRFFFDSIKTIKILTFLILILLPFLHGSESDQNEFSSLSKNSTQFDQLMQSWEYYLQPLSSNCYYFHERQKWWSYSFCFGANVTQFHVSSKQTLEQVIQLGSFQNTTTSDTDINETADEIDGSRSNPSNKASIMSKEPYHHYRNGHLCEGEDAPKNEKIQRSTHITFHCCTSTKHKHISHFIAHILERKTCEYEIKFCTSYLCDTPYYGKEEREEIITQNEFVIQVNKQKPIDSDDTQQQSSSTTKNAENNLLTTPPPNPDDPIKSLEINLLNMKSPPSFSWMELLTARENVRAMFIHGWDSYLEHAYPKGELKPLSCVGDEFSLIKLDMVTFIDAMDSLPLMGEMELFREAVDELIYIHYKTLEERGGFFNVDVSVSVFETTIRLLGGLISSHLLILDQDFLNYTANFEKKNEEEVDWIYRNELLELAIDLGDRLLPAFDTPTGIPFGTVNLMHGVPRGETTISSVAGAGSLTLEFATLSSLTGNQSYRYVAESAVLSLHEKRSELGLIGKHINVKQGKWTETVAGVGSNSDSYYEYLGKMYFLFQDPMFWQTFTATFKSIKALTQAGDYFVEVDMANAKPRRQRMENLAAFWPGLEGSLGEYQSSSRVGNAFYQVWREVGFLPEEFDFVNWNTGKGIGGQVYYPLRPELIESTYFIYKATFDPTWVQAALDFYDSIENYAKTDCGYASLDNILTLSLRDEMPSYFLSETTKYLYMIFDLALERHPDNKRMIEEYQIVDQDDPDIHYKVTPTLSPIHQRPFVFTTEAHPFPADLIRSIFHSILVDKGGVSLRDEPQDLLTTTSPTTTFEKFSSSSKKSASFSMNSQNTNKNQQLEEELFSVKDFIRPSVRMEDEEVGSMYGVSTMEYIAFPPSNSSLESKNDDINDLNDLHPSLSPSILLSDIVLVGKSQNSSSFSLNGEELIPSSLLLNSHQSSPSQSTVSDHHESSLNTQVVMDNPSEVEEEKEEGLVEASISEFDGNENVVVYEMNEIPKDDDTSIISKLGQYVSNTFQSLSSSTSDSSSSSTSSTKNTINNSPSLNQRSSKHYPTLSNKYQRVKNPTATTQDSNQQVINHLSKILSKLVVPGIQTSQCPFFNPLLDFEPYSKTFEDKLAGVTIPTSAFPSLVSRSRINSEDIIHPKCTWEQIMEGNNLVKEGLEEDDDVKLTNYHEKLRREMEEKEKKKQEDESSSDKLTKQQQQQNQKKSSSSSQSSNQQQQPPNQITPMSLQVPNVGHFQVTGYGDGFVIYSETHDERLEISRATNDLYYLRNILPNDSIHLFYNNQKDSERLLKEGKVPQKEDLKSKRSSNLKNVVGRVALDSSEDYYYQVSKMFGLKGHQISCSLSLPPILVNSPPPPIRRPSIPHLPCSLGTFGPGSLNSFQDSVPPTSSLPLIIPSKDNDDGLPFFGCSPPKTPSDYKNKILIVTRGDCMFEEKALYAQQGGAEGVIVINKEDVLFVMAGMPIEQRREDLKEAGDVSIPTVLVSRSHGYQLMEYLRMIQPISIEGKGYDDDSLDHHVSINIHTTSPTLKENEDKNLDGNTFEEDQLEKIATPYVIHNEETNQVYIAPISQGWQAILGMRDDKIGMFELTLGAFEKEKFGIKFSDNEEKNDSKEEDKEINKEKIQKTKPTQKKQLSKMDKMKVKEEDHQNKIEAWKENLNKERSKLLEAHTSSSSQESTQSKPNFKILSNIDPPIFDEEYGTITTFFSKDKIKRMFNLDHGKKYVEGFHMKSAQQICVPISLFVNPVQFYHNRYLRQSPSFLDLINGPIPAILYEKHGEEPF